MSKKSKIYQLKVADPLKRVKSRFKENHFDLSCLVRVVFFGFNLSSPKLDSWALMHPVRNGIFSDFTSAASIKKKIDSNRTIHSSNIHIVYANLLSRLWMTTITTALCVNLLFQRRRKASLWLRTPRKILQFRKGVVP